jgi:hypothetical protein
VSLKPSENRREDSSNPPEERYHCFISELDD